MSSRWSILPTYLVRMAGFSFARLAALRCTEAARFATLLDAAGEARRDAGTALDTLLSNERYSEYPAFDDPAVRKVLSRCVKQTRAWARQLATTPMPEDAMGEVARVVPKSAPAIAALAASHAAWLEATSAYERAFADDFERTRVAIRTLYRDEPRLQEAVFLESRAAFNRIQQLLETSGPRDARARQRERLAAMYAQRFCSKNETNSICGPHGFGTIDRGEGAASIAIVAEDARRETYFSHWAAQRLLDAAVRRADDDATRTLQLNPSARVDDANVLTFCTMTHDATTMFRRRHGRSELSPAVARVLAMLRTPCTPIALVAAAAVDDIDADEITGFVDELVEAGIVLRGPVLPTGLFRPLRQVAEIVERWPASEARGWAIDEVAAFETMISAFASAPLERRLALAGELEARFMAATGDAAQRGSGQHYADRSLLHEDCFVDVRTQLGPTRAALDGPLPVLVATLELPLALARERVREWFRARFPGGARVPALEVHRAFDDDRVLETPASTPHAAALRGALDRVRDVFARAAAIAGGGPVRIATGELRQAIAIPDAPSHGGYVSADVMIRRTGATTELVLGEVHGFFWLPTCLLDILPPEVTTRVVDEMRAALREVAAGRHTAECVFLHTQATDRRFPLAETDLQMLVASERPGAVEFGALDVRLVGDELEYWHGDREVVPLVAYARYPFVMYTSRVAPLFDDYAERFFPDVLLPPSLRDRDSPRLALDDLIFQRRTWRRPVGPIKALLLVDREAELLRRGLAFQRELGCEDRVFVSLPGEPKPIMLDFHNVFMLEALVNLLKQQPDTASLKISEMMPGPDELVAQGPDGPRTSELRMGFYRTPG